MSAAGTSQREITRVIRRSKTVVHGLLRNPEDYNTARHLSKRSSLAPAIIRRIVRVARTGQYSSRSSSAPSTSPSQLALYAVWLYAKTRCVT